MHIEELKLTNYRNYPKLEIGFDDKVNVIIGENAQGKTNLMEAIYLLAFTKSHRTSKEKELIRWDEDYAKIEGRVKRKIILYHLKLLFPEKEKSEIESFRTKETK
nr:AAA family ATPase [Ornithinibacillus scapharcae]